MGRGRHFILQLETIRLSNDQSIFPWGCNEGDVRTGSILADDPSFFRGCGRMELMDPDGFIQHLENLIPKERLQSIKRDRFGTFPITNRGIQIWLLLCPYHDSRSVFQAWLPCRPAPYHGAVTINLAVWESNYYRYPRLEFPTDQTLQVPPSLSQVSGHASRRYIPYRGQCNYREWFHLLRRIPAETRRRHAHTNWRQSSLC